MTGFTELLNEATTRINDFYRQAIALHNNPHLRSIGGQGRIRLVENLFYDNDGFNARVAIECIEQGNAWEGGSYRYAERPFYVKDDRLVVDADKYGTPEMLHLFPSLSIKSLEEKLAQELQKTRWLKGGGTCDL